MVPAAQLPAGRADESMERLDRGPLVRERSHMEDLRGAPFAEALVPHILERLGQPAYDLQIPELRR